MYARLQAKTITRIPKHDEESSSVVEHQAHNLNGISSSRISMLFLYSHSGTRLPVYCSRHCEHLYRVYACERMSLIAFQYIFYIVSVAFCESMRVSRFIYVRYFFSRVCLYLHFYCKVTGKKPFDA